MVFVTFHSCEKDEELNGNIITVSEDITSPTTWESAYVYVIENGIWINSNLTIEPGTVIKFKSGAWISFGSSENVTLTAIGTEDEPIIFTSYATNPSAGAWQGLWIESNVLSNSSMSYCEIKYAGQDNYPALNFDSKIHFNNCTIENAKKDGIYSYAGFMSFSGNTVNEIGGHAIDIECVGVKTIGDNNLLSSNSGYGINIREGLLDDATAETWKKQTVPYYIQGGIWVDKNITLEAGSTLKFHANAWITFGNANNSTFTAVGTETEPIVFTSASATPAPGAWSGLFFESNTSTNSLLKNCIVEYGGKDDYANISLSEVNGLTIENCIIRNSSNYGIYTYSSTWTNLNNTFENNSSGDIFSE